MPMNQSNVIRLPADASKQAALKKKMAECAKLLLRPAVDPEDGNTGERGYLIQDPSDFGAACWMAIIDLLLEQRTLEYNDVWTILIKENPDFAEWLNNEPLLFQTPWAKIKNFCNGRGQL